MERRMTFVVALAAAIAVVGGGTALATGAGVLGGVPDGGVGNLAPVLTPDDQSGTEVEAPESPEPIETTGQPEPIETTHPSTRPTGDDHRGAGPTTSRAGDRSDDDQHTTVTPGRTSDD
jgi:hypothetical protein